MYCKDCKHWLSTNGNIGKCEHQKVFSYQEDEESEDLQLDSMFYTDPDTSDSTYTGKDFGCIHFERGL